MIVNVKIFCRRVCRLDRTMSYSMHVDDVSRIQTHTHIHKNSDFLIVTIRAGLAQDLPNYVVCL